MNRQPQSEEREEVTEARRGRGFHRGPPEDEVARRSGALAWRVQAAADGPLWRPRRPRARVPLRGHASPSRPNVFSIETSSSPCIGCEVSCPARDGAGERKTAARHARDIAVTRRCASGAPRLGTARCGSSSSMTSLPAPRH